MRENITKAIDMYDSAFAALLALIDNIVEGMLRLETSRAERVSAQVTREIFSRRIPFSGKIPLLEAEFNKIQDPEIRKQFLLKLEECKSLEMNASRGLNEIERLVKHTKLPDKDRFIKFLQECRYSLSDPYRVQVSRSVYTQFVAYMNERRNNGLFERDGILSDSFVHALGSSDGSYYIFTTNEFRSYVDQMLRAAAISCAKLQNPSRQDLEMEIMTRYGKKDGIKTNRAATFVFKGMTPEFAEKIVREGLNRGCVFAKEISADGTSSVICSASGDVDERDQRYKKAVMSISAAAIAMTGKNGDIEKKRMRHYITEQDKIDKAISSLEEGSREGGFFVTLNTEDGYVVPKETIEFDSESFTLTTANGKGQTIYSDPKDNARMISSLRHCVQTGTGDKVFVSREDMDTIYHKAEEFKVMMTDYDSKLAMMSHLDEKLQSLENEYDEIRKNPSQKAMAAAVRSEKNNVLQMQRMLSRTDSFPPSEFDITRAVLGGQLQERKFYAYHDIQTNEISKVEAKCTQYGLANAAKSMSLTNQMDLNSEGVSPVIGNNDIREIIGSISVDDFIEHELRRAEPDIEGQDQSGAFTVSDVRKESKILRGDLNTPGFEDYGGYETHRQEALDMISGISIQMEQVYCPPILENSTDIDRTPSERSEEKEKSFMTRADSMIKPKDQITEKRQSLFEEDQQKETEKTPKKIPQKTI